MRVLISRGDAGQRARQRDEQLLIDGHDWLLAGSTHKPHLKMAELPSVLPRGDPAALPVDSRDDRSSRARSRSPPAPPQDQSASSLPCTAGRIRRSSRRSRRSPNPLPVVLRTPWPAVARHARTTSRVVMNLGT